MECGLRTGVLSDTSQNIPGELKMALQTLVLVPLVCILLPTDMGMPHFSMAVKPSDWKFPPVRKIGAEQVGCTDIN